MSSLHVPGQAQAYATKGALTHVIEVPFMCLQVGAERENGVFGSSDLLTNHHIPGGKMFGDPIIGWQCIKPENSIFH